MDLPADFLNPVCGLTALCHEDPGLPAARFLSGCRIAAFGGASFSGAELRHITSARDIDLNFVRNRLAGIVLAQCRAQPLRVHAHGGIGDGIESGRPSERPHCDVIGLEGLRVSVEGCVDHEAQKCRQCRRSSEAATCANSQIAAKQDNLRRLQVLGQSTGGPIGIKQKPGLPQQPGFRLCDLSKLFGLDGYLLLLLLSLHGLWQGHGQYAFFVSRGDLVGIDAVRQREVAFE